MGKGVSKAINNILNVIKPALVGKDATEQKAIDDLMVREFSKFECLPRLLFYICWTGSTTRRF